MYNNNVIQTLTNLRMLATQPHTQAAAKAAIAAVVATGITPQVANAHYTLAKTVLL